MASQVLSHHHMRSPFLVFKKNVFIANVITIHAVIIIIDNITIIMLSTILKPIKNKIIILKNLGKG